METALLAGVPSTIAPSDAFSTPAPSDDEEEQQEAAAAWNPVAFVEDAAEEEGPADGEGSVLSDTAFVDADGGDKPIPERGRTKPTSVRVTCPLCPARYGVEVDVAVSYLPRHRTLWHKGETWPAALRPFEATYRKMQRMGLLRSTANDPPEPQGDADSEILLPHPDMVRDAPPTVPPRVLAGAIAPLDLELPPPVPGAINNESNNNISDDDDAAGGGDVGDIADAAAPEVMVAAEVSVAAEVMVAPQVMVPAEDAPLLATTPTAVDAVADDAAVDVLEPVSPADAPSPPSSPPSWQADIVLPPVHETLTKEWDGPPPHIRTFKTPFPGVELDLPPGACVCVCA